MAGFAFQFAWGLVVLAALVGWGGVATRLAGPAAFPEGRPDWGLMAGLGMALVLAAGGVLALLGLARPAVLIAVVVAGAGLFAADLIARRRRSDPDGRPRPPAWLLIVVVVPLLARYAGAVAYQTTSCSDDHIAYFAFVARLLDTGTLIDPFSLRRLTAFGGQTFLQALVMVAGSADNGHLFDRGIALVVVFGLVVGFFGKRGRAKAPHCLLALVLTMALPFPVLNSSSHVSGLAMLLTLYRMLHLTPTDGQAAAAGRLWLIGGVAAGAASLKATLLVVAAATVACWWLLAAVRVRPGAGGGDWRRLGRAAVHVGISGLAAIAPWMALMWLSSGTPLYPLIQGVHRPGFAETYSGRLPVHELLANLAHFLLLPQIGLLLVPLVLYAFRRANPAGLALYAGALVGTAATVLTLTYDSDWTLHRYVAPFLNAAFIATVVFFMDEILAGLPETAAGRRPAAGTAILAAMALVLLPVIVYHDLGRVAGQWGRTALAPDQRALYQRMQAAVPPGAGLLAVIAHPFALDFARNPIVGLDVPGAAGPDPGVPYFRGPAALKAYLAGQSIGYAAIRDFAGPGGCLYGRAMWTAHAAGKNPMWRGQSRYYLDLMNNLDALAETEKVIFAEGGLRVLALR